jgi:hypothetical protein
MIRFTTALLLALLVLPLAAGCGGDDEQAEAPRDLPELTIPRTDPEPDPPETAPTPTTETDTTPPATGEDPSTAPLAPGEGDGTGSDPTGGTDTPENDTAPPAGSPAERFEQECEENPGACG